MSQVVLCFLHGASVLSFYLDVVLTLSIEAEVIVKLHACVFGPGQEICVL